MCLSVVWIHVCKDTQRKLHTWLLYKLSQLMLSAAQTLVSNLNTQKSAMIVAISLLNTYIYVMSHSIVAFSWYMMKHCGNLLYKYSFLTCLVVFFSDIQGGLLKNGYSISAPRWIAFVGVWDLTFPPLLHLLPVTCWLHQCVKLWNG